MLIEFRVENFRSLRDEQTFSMIASETKRHRTTHVRRGVADGFDLLQTALVYGPNASGKTNLVLALNVLGHLVTPPRERDRPGDPIRQIDPFRLTASTRGAPTTFEVGFVEDGVRYRYGVVLTSERVEEEWLYAYPVRERLLFSRVRDAVELGPTLRTAEVRSVLRLVSKRPEALFLSLLGEFDIAESRPAVAWFSDRLRFIGGTDFPDVFTKRMLSTNPGARRFVLELLRKADTGIRDVEVREETVEIPDAVRRAFQEAMPHGAVPSEQQQITAQFIHTGGEGEEAMLDEADESMGTMHLLALAGPLYDVLRSGFVLVVDELDTSLHPALVRALVGLFHSPDLNPNGAQLIATTHDTTLLDTRILRPDNVWLTEKDRDGATRLYPLSDYAVRSDALIGKLYHQGRVGGLPVLGFSLLDAIDDYAEAQ